MSRLRRGAFGFAALLAVALQVLVVQSHVHPFGVGHAAPAVAQSANDVTAHAGDAAGDAQRVCVICQALAAGGRMLLPDGPKVARAESGVFERTALVIRFVAVGFSHSWRSRAPPFVL